MSTDSGVPVTVVVRHRVKPGKKREFEEWLRGISREALKFPGHLGFNVIRPSDSANPEYLVLFRFDTLPNLESWETSEIRRQWLERLKPLVVQEASREQYTGLEVWFTPPGGCAPPPRYKMVVVTLLAIYPLILLMQSLVAPLLSHWPIVLRTLFTSIVLVLLMSYFVMPLMTRLFSRWLYRRAQSQPQVSKMSAINSPRST